MVAVHPAGTADLQAEAAAHPAAEVAERWVVEGGMGYRSYLFSLLFIQNRFMLP